MTPYYEDSAVTIYHGDCREISIEAPSVITDPPFGETSLPWDKWPNGWVQSLSPSCNSLWCFGSLRMFFEHLQEFQDWKLAQEIIWEKHNGSSLHVDRFRKVHELAVQFYRGEWANIYHEPVKSNDATKRSIRRNEKPAHWGSLKSAGVFEAEDGGPRLMRSVIYEPSMHRRAEHPTQKPEGIVFPLVEYSVPLGGIVYDPFMGSGTTLSVAKQIGRKAVGCDADEHSCEIAAKRMAQEVLAFG